MLLSILYQMQGPKVTKKVTQIVTKRPKKALRASVAPSQAIRIAELNARNYPQITENPDKSLTSMQREFVRYMAEFGLTQTAAARMAGFSAPEVDGARLMKSPAVLANLQAERAKYAVASNVTRKQVIEGFIEAVDLARIKGEPLTMVAGWREVGKMCGFYEPSRSEVKISVGGQVMLHQLNGMSDDELLQMVESTDLKAIVSEQ